MTQKKAKKRLKKPKISSKKSAAVWSAPKIFDLYSQENRRHLLSKLTVLRQYWRLRDSLTLDFSCTEKLFADGALLFLAEVRRMQKHLPKSAIGCIPPTNAKVSQVLQQIGFFKLIGAPEGVTPSDDDVINWRFAHSKKVEGEKYEDVLGEFDGAIAEPLREDLFKGITEAMTNVVNHAYEIPRGDGLGISQSREWWMFSQHKDGELTVVFLDLGAGIPKTLPIKQPNLWRKLIRFGRKKDSLAIEYALKDSISRTGLVNRGKGLGQIVRAVASEPNHQIAIYSNRGVYRSNNGIPKRNDYDDSIFGTLIFWNFQLQSKELT